MRATVLLVAVAVAVVSAAGVLQPKEEALLEAGSTSTSASMSVAAAMAEMRADSIATSDSALHTADHRQRMASGVGEATVQLHGSASAMGHGVTGIIHIPLARSLVNRHSAVLLEFQARQLDSDDGVGSSLLETAAKDVPLTQEVLREKHLATYYGIVNIGDTPFRILFDTGSCEFWVPSSECDMDRCKRHKQYPIEEHSDSRFMAKNRLNIQYLSGRVSGKMVYESVHTGDVTVKRQIVGVADHVDIVLLDDVIWDGILGLAYPNKGLTRKGVVPFFDNVIKSGALKKRGLSNQFGYYIDDSRGSVTFGGVDCGLLGSPNCIKHFGFVPVSEKTYWTIRLNDVRVEYADGKKMSGFCPRAGCKAIVDTGTYLLYGPGAAVRKMLRPAKFAGCSTYQRLPTFTFDFKVGEDAPSVELSLRPIDYVLKFSNDGTEECVTGISPDRDVIWTLGQVFLRSFYTVFDRDLNRIGFARLPRTDFQAINAHADAEAQAALLEAHSEGSAGALDFAELLKSGATTEDQVLWAEQHSAEDEETAVEMDAEDAEEEADAEDAAQAQTELDASVDADADSEVEVEDDEAVDVDTEDFAAAVEANSFESGRVDDS